MKKLAEGRQFTEGDQQTFHELYLQYRHRVYSTCLRMTQNISESEDTTSSFSCFEQLEAFAVNHHFTTWLHRLTVNQVLMHFRKCKVRPDLTTGDVGLAAHVAASNQGPKQLGVVDRILLSEVIAKLPEGYRQVVILHDIEGLGHREIAERRDRSIGTSKSQLHKGRALLRKLIGGHRHVNSRSVASTA